MCVYIYIYIHIHIHTYIHTCMHTYIHTYIHICFAHRATCTDAEKVEVRKPNG